MSIMKRPFYLIFLFLFAVPSVSAFFIGANYTTITTGKQNNDQAQETFCTRFQVNTTSDNYNNISVKNTAWDAAVENVYIQVGNSTSPINGAGNVIARNNSFTGLYNGQHNLTVAPFSMSTANDYWVCVQKTGPATASYSTWAMGENTHEYKPSVMNYTGSPAWGAISGARDLFFKVWYLSPAGTANHFVITAYHNITATQIINYSAWVNGSLYNTTNGSIVLPYLDNQSGTLNISIVNENVGGYYSRLYSSVPITAATLRGDLYPYFYVHNVTYANNYTLANGNVVARNVTFSAVISCPYNLGNTTVRGKVNGSDVFTITGDCGNRTAWAGNYSHIIEGPYVLSLHINTTHDPAYNNNKTTNNYTFVSDLNNPTVSIYFYADNGFMNQSNTSTLVNCSDNYADYIINTVWWDGTIIHHNRTPGNLTIANNSVITYGENTLNATCSDHFGNTSSNLSRFIYINQLCLIDEKDNTAFDVLNITRARVMLDDNSSSYDLRAKNQSCVNFSSLSTNNLRFDLGYLSGTTITRYVDTSLWNGSLRVCANREGTTHYEQLIISAEEKAAVLKSVYSNCVVAQDYTRFAYQEGRLLKAFTIETLYYLYTYDEGEQVYLASVDGSVATYINLDSLEYSLTEVSTDIQEDTLLYERYDNTTFLIRYYNLANASSGASMTIYLMNESGSTYIFTQSAFTDPDSIIVYLNYASLPTTNGTIFYVDLNVTAITGGVTNHHISMPISAGQLKVAGQIAFVISLFLLIFGLTLTAVRYTFSFFGIFILIGALGVLSLSSWTWYNLFLGAIEIILLMYIGILTVKQNNPMVA